MTLEFSNPAPDLGKLLFKKKRFQKKTTSSTQLTKGKRHEWPQQVKRQWYVGDRKGKNCLHFQKGANQATT